MSRPGCPCRPSGSELTTLQQVSDVGCGWLVLTESTGATMARITRAPITPVATPMPTGFERWPTSGRRAADQPGPDGGRCGRRWILRHGQLSRIGTEGTRQGQADVDQQVDRQRPAP